MKLNQGRDQGDKDKAKNEEKENNDPNRENHRKNSSGDGNGSDDDEDGDNYEQINEPVDELEMRLIEFSDNYILCSTFNLGSTLYYHCTTLLTSRLLV